MRNTIDIDRSHSLAILREIGERLRVSLQEQPQPSANLRTQIDRLRELEYRAPSPSIIPLKSAAEVASNSAWSTYLLLHKEVDEDDARRSTLQRYITHLCEDGEHNPDTLQTAGLAYLRRLDHLHEERERRLATYRALNETR